MSLLSVSFKRDGGRGFRDKTVAVARRFADSRWLPVYVVAEALTALGLSLFFRSRVLLFLLDALLFFPVFAACLFHWRIPRLVAAATLWGAVKSLAFMGCIILFRDSVASLVDSGSAYHADTLSWILVNDGQNAHPEVFSRLHVWGMLRVLASSAGSFGLVTLIGGSRELNIMNFHVASLLRDARQPIRILFLGWPPWSLLRGWAYLFLMIGSAPVFAAVVRRQWPEWKRLAPFLVAGFVLAGVDLGLKVLFAPAWRRLLLEAYH